MSTPGARIYDVGYRSYDGPRRPPWWAVATVCLHAIQRVLGLRRPFRHKILPALAIIIAFLPAIVTIVVAVMIEDVLTVGDDLVTYGDYYFFIASAIGLFAAFVAPEALCTDRRTGMLGLDLAGPLDRGRYLLAKAGAVLGVMLLMTLAPPLFLMIAYAVEGLGPSGSDLPLLALRIVATGLSVAALFTAVGLGAASLTSRKAIAGIVVVLLVLVPGIVAEIAIESGGAPNALSLFGLLGLPTELALRISIGQVSTALVVLGVAAWTAAGAAVTWLAYRRIEAHS
jgi:ABC-2 type transport system permease protein